MSVVQRQNKNEVTTRPYFDIKYQGKNPKNDILDINPNIKNCTIEESIQSIKKCIKLHKKNA